MLSEFQKGGMRSLRDVIEGIVLTTHTGSSSSVEKATIYARYPSSVSGGYVHLHTALSDICMYPNYADMADFARRLAPSGEYEDDIAGLLNPNIELVYMNS